MDNNNIERIGVHKASLYFLEKFKWLEREQPISDYGIDMEVEIVENKEVTGTLIALQIKSGKSFFENIKNENIIFRGKLRHLKYWENHSLPVVIILYNPDKGKLYWQSISSKNANIKLCEKSWTMQIPLRQELTDTNKISFLEECFNFDAYDIVIEDDISINQAIRYTMKIIIYSKEKYIIKKIIDNIHHKLLDIYKNINTLTIFYYKSLNEVHNGLPFCTSQWNDSKSKYKLNTIESNDEIGDIFIEWNREYQIFNKFHISNNNFISKFKL